MADLASLPDDEELRRKFGTPTFERAHDYVRRSKVLECTHYVDRHGDLDIRGTVTGSGGQAYAAFLTVGFGRQGHWSYTRCTCPVGDDCKHALALLLTVIAERRRAEDAADAVAGKGWERQLDSVLDELDELDDSATDLKPLAIQVDLGRAPPTRNQAWSPTGPQRGALRIRPLQRGARDNWVRQGIGWQEVPHLGTRRVAHPPPQVAALRELLTAYRLESGLPFHGAEPHLLLASFGDDLWRLMARAADHGVELVPGEGLAEVHLAQKPVTLEVDINAAPQRDAQLRLGVWSDDRWYAADDLEVIGDGGAGVALWTATDDPREWVLTLAELIAPAGPHVRRLLALGDSLVVPVGDRDDLIAEYLPRLQRHLPISSSDGSVDVPQPVMPRLVITITWVAVDQVLIEWTWRYKMGTDDRVYQLSELRGLRGLRRPDAEQALLDSVELTDVQIHRLCESGVRESGLIESQTFTRDAAIAFVEDVLPGLEASEHVEIEEIGGRPDYRAATSAPVIHFAARGDAADDLDARTDWLDLEVVITIDGQSMALVHLLEALTRQQERIVLANGTHVRLDHPEFAHLAELIEQAGELHEQPRDGVRVNHLDLGLWDELAEVGIVDAQAGDWVRAAQALRNIEKLPDVEPTGLTADLRHYQREGFNWLVFLWEAKLGGILADDMGLGKTLQTLALIAHARANGAAPFLVVAPTSVVSTWAHEAASFTPGLVVREITESQAKRRASIGALSDEADIVVTSYTLYRLEADDYIAQRWGGLVLDEAQMVKNHLGKTYQSVRRLDAPFRIALTGTPMENRLMELWSLLSIVAPGLYAYPQRFAELVSVPVERLGDSAALERFRRKIRPFLMRRTKELVAADLPPKQEQVLEVQLTPRHRRVYETHLQRERQTVLGLVDEDFDKHRIAIFRSLTKLRQLSLDASLVDEAYDGIGSAKVDVLVDHLHEVVAEGHRALVFSQFTSFLTRVRRRLDSEAITSTYLDGRTRKRGTVIDDFKTGDAGVFLISLKAGGVGLTLTEADYVFVLDPWWNPAVESQAVDRTHRIGQRRPVMVYRLVAVNTIEEKVMELKARKAALFAKVLDGDGSLATPIDARDVRRLFED